MAEERHGLSDAVTALLRLDATVPSISRTASLLSLELPRHIHFSGLLLFPCLERCFPNIHMIHPLLCSELHLKVTPSEPFLLTSPVCPPTLLCFSSTAVISKNVSSLAAQLPKSGGLVCLAQVFCTVFLRHQNSAGHIIGTLCIS